jgi:hypothetical protein
LVHMGARWYNSRIGRWISPDTIVPAPANPQSLNRFAYVYNNSINLFDPGGYDPLNPSWTEEFERNHHREPDWYDRLIRLFSIAFPEEWNWSKFYDADGRLKGHEVLRDIMFNPGATRNWASMPDVLARLAGWYESNEKGAFVRDVATLFAGIPDRFDEPANTIVSDTSLPNRMNDWAYLRREGLPESLTGRVDRDANVHHWAWAFLLGYQYGYAGLAMNTAREIHGAGMNPLRAYSNREIRADIYLGNRAALMGVDVRVFGASPVQIRRFWSINILHLGHPWQ